MIPRKSALPPAVKDPLRRMYLKLDRVRSEARFELQTLRSATITHDMWEGYGLPFNGQRLRLQTIRRLITEYDPDVFVETGTFLGHTTRFFLGQGVPVWTVEAKRSFFLTARVRLGLAEGLTMIHGNSPDVVRRLRSEGFERPFFYLDAHWWANQPLAEELGEIAAGWENALLVIDDGKVPEDEGYTYDVDADIPLAAENLPISDRMVLGYPAEPSENETGARRGTIYIAQGETARSALDATASVRQASTLPV